MNNLENWKTKYNKLREELYHDLVKNKITYEKTREILNEMYNMIPNNVHIDEFAINDLLKRKFKNHPDWNQYNKIYHITVPNIPENESEDYIKNVAQK